MSENHAGYSVFLFDAAIEALGEAIRPYLQDGRTGPHIPCDVVDTGGAFVEMTVRARNRHGDSEQVHLMVPAQMVRMIVSSHSDTAFGFAATHLEPGLTALPVVGPTAPAPQSPSTAMPHGMAVPGANAGPGDAAQPPEG
ncbi:MAG: hypothetical protein ACOY37_00295 [Pseudomonadota bacterium]